MLPTQLLSFAQTPVAHAFVVPTSRKEREKWGTRRFSAFRANIDTGNSHPLENNFGVVFQNKLQPSTTGMRVLFRAEEKGAV
jgi:hypothetical protein